MNTRELFQSPPSEFRGKPFWALNGRLEEAEMRRQIGVFQEMGLGGAFLHSRVGLGTPYLSDEWFKLMRACADECKKRKMEAWLYDEDRWPSGAAGGLVTKDEKYRIRMLSMETVEPAKYSPDPRDIAAFAAVVDGSKASGVRPFKAGTDAKPGESVLVFRVIVQGVSPWYNDAAYLDTMSPEAVWKFIQVTHDAYAREMGSDFGTVVPGIFTDEPNYFGGGWNSRNELPWTGGIPEAFERRYGYDLLGRLPELFYTVDGETYSRVRRDFYDCATHLFVESFSGQIGRWCGTHGIRFTGHVLCEETLRTQTGFVGAAMRFYEYMQAPGIDILTGQVLKRPGGREPEYLTAKQCASALRQFGRTWMLSELYGCTGWQFTFAEHKAVGDWQAAMGVNLRCPHLSYYTMAGEAKRDYPASISYQSPWCKDYGLVEDYFSRVGVMLTGGEPVRDIAVIHPIESGWGVNIPGDSGKIDDLNGKLEEVQRILLEEHLDFDYVDEDILSRHGSVSATEFRVAQASYRTIVVPPMITIRKSTLDMLGRFVDGGGTVVFVQPVPVRTDSDLSIAAAELARRSATCPLDREKLVSALLAPGKLRRVSVSDVDGSQCRPVLYMMRREPKTGRTTVFLCNTIQASGTKALTVRIPAKGQVQEWDPVTGEVWVADARADGDDSVVATSMAGSGSRLFVVDPAADSSLKPRPEPKEIRHEAVNPAAWAVRLDEPNAMPLDMPEYSISGGDWKEPTEILKVDRVVRDAAGLRHRGGAMVQPWADTTPPDLKTVPVRLRYRFAADTVPASACHLVMEFPEKFRVSLNGKPLATNHTDGWWIDRSFNRIVLPVGSIKKGDNELLLETDYGPKSGLECLYLAGDFGARWENRKAVLTAPVKNLKLGDWRSQGLPCYTGMVSYSATVAIPAGSGNRVMLALPAWDGTLVKISVNGKKAGRIAWPPYETDITPALIPGNNLVEITVVSSRRNLLGPLHLKELYPGWTGPGEFVSDGDRFTPDYVSVPYGLMEPPLISYRQ